MNISEFVEAYNSGKEVSLPGFGIREDGSPGSDTKSICNLTAIMANEVVNDEFQLPESKDDGTFSDENVNTLKQYFDEVIKRENVSNFIIMTCMNDSMIMQCINMVCVMAKSGVDELIKQGKAKDVQPVTFTKQSMNEIREVIREEYKDNAEIQFLLMMGELKSKTDEINKFVSQIKDRPKYLN